MLGAPNCFEPPLFFVMEQGLEVSENPKPSAAWGLVLQQKVDVFVQSTAIFHAPVTATWAPCFFYVSSL